MDSTGHSIIVALLLSLGVSVVRAETVPAALVPNQGVIRDHLLTTKSLLRDGKVRNASERAATAYDLWPDAAETQTLLGDISFRKADFEKASALYQSALDLNPTCARAYLGLGRIQQLHFRRRLARDYLAQAYKLDPHDPEIIRIFASLVPNRKTELALLKEYVALGMLEGLEEFESVVGHLKFHERLGGRPLAKLATPYQPYNLHLTNFYPQGGRAGGLILKVALNGGRPLRLVLDTGAKGILINKSQADKLGLENMGESGLRGLGNSGITKATIALARTVQIDDLVILNGLVEALEHPVTYEADGVIGASVFQQFLVKLSCSEKLLQLLPFDERSITDFGEEEPWQNWEPQVPVTMENVIPLHQIGHLLFIKATVNRQAPGYYLLDTGAPVTSVAQKTPMNRNVDYGPRYHGASGWLPRSVHTGPVEIAFSGMALVEPNVISFDHEKISNQIGIEVSGLLGYPSLSRSAMTTINYRDGLMQFSMRH